MRFYKLTAEQRAKIEALNEKREGTLLIVCDHGNGNIGVDADAFEHSNFSMYFAELGGAFDFEKVVNLQL